MGKLNRIQILLFIIAILAFGLFNKLIMPIRKELTELELSKVIGMDRINEGKYRVEQTVVRIGAEEMAQRWSTRAEYSKC